MIKICLYTPVWKRPELTRLHFENVKRIVNYKPKTFQIIPFFVVSEIWAQDLCKEFGFEYCFTENLPLGKKMNTGLKEILNGNFDWLLTNGSDDFAEPKFLDEYLPHFKTKKAFGQSIVNVLDAETGIFREWQIGYSFGALRAIRIDAIRQSVIRNGAYYGLWENGLNRGLDFYSAQNLKTRSGVDVDIVQIKTRLWDVKTGVSINSSRRVKGAEMEINIKELPLEIRCFMSSEIRLQKFQSSPVDQPVNRKLSRAKWQGRTKPQR